jgi:hypothetical protein
MSSESMKILIKWKLILSNDNQFISKKTNRLVLGCQGFNIWGVIRPNDTEIRSAISSLSLFIDISDMAINSTLQLFYDDGKVFKCTNNPIEDYYTLTKQLNLLEQAKKVKKWFELGLKEHLYFFYSITLILKIKDLLTNQQTNNSKLPIPTVNCLKIDQVYQKARVLQQSLEKDSSRVLQKKLECFRSSIFLPFNSYIAFIF